MKTKMFIVGFFLFTLIFVFIISATQKKSLSGIHISGLPTPTPIFGTNNSTAEPGSYTTRLLTPVPNFIADPTGTTVSISGVAVNNFFPSSPPVDKQGDRQIAAVQGSYQIIFVNQYNQFLISITGSPFNSNRQIAEAAFLQSLNISQQEACKLDVSITTPQFVNPNEAGQQYPLSFCPVVPTP